MLCLHFVVASVFLFFSALKVLLAGLAKGEGGKGCAVLNYHFIIRVFVV